MTSESGLNVGKPPVKLAGWVQTRVAFSVQFVVALQLFFVGVQA